MKLTQDKIKEIKELQKKGLKQKEIIEIANISRGTLIRLNKEIRENKNELKQNKNELKQNKNELKQNENELNKNETENKKPIEAKKEITSNYDKQIDLFESLENYKNTKELKKKRLSELLDNFNELKEKEKILLKEITEINKTL